MQPARFRHSYPHQRTSGLTRWPTRSHDVTSGGARPTRPQRRIWHSLLAAAARPASAHIAHVLCALNRRRIRCRQSEGWLRHYRRPTRPGIWAGCSSLAALAGHRLMVTADPRPLVGSHPRGHRTQVLTVFRLPAAQFVKAPDLLGLGEQEPVIIYRNRVVT